LSGFALPVFNERELAVRDLQVTCWSEAGISTSYKNEEGLKENKNLTTCRLKSKKQNCVVLRALLLEERETLLPLRSPGSASSSYGTARLVAALRRVWGEGVLWRKAEILG